MCGRGVSCGRDVAEVCRDRCVAEVCRVAEVRCVAEVCRVAEVGLTHGSLAVHAELLGFFTIKKKKARISSV